MSECFEQIHRAILSYDESDLRAYVFRAAHAARRNHQAVEALIIDLKLAVNRLPLSSLRERVRRELRDSVVRMAIRAYYDHTDALTAARPRAITDTTSGGTHAARHSIRGQLRPKFRHAPVAWQRL